MLGGELPVVKTFYKELAAIEKHNHGKALSSCGPGARGRARGPKKTKLSVPSALRRNSTGGLSSNTSTPPANTSACDAVAKLDFMELDAEEFLSALSFGEPISSFFFSGDYFEPQTSALDEQIGPGEEWFEHRSEYSRRLQKIDYKLHLPKTETNRPLWSDSQTIAQSPPIPLASIDCPEHHRNSRSTKLANQLSTECVLRAFWSKDLPSVAKIALEGGARVDLRGAEGCTFLHMATRP
jgi:hypothetical protein